MDIFVKLFSGIGTFFIEDPKIAIARFLLIVLGFILAWMGFRRKLEPLIMVPMGLGMIAVNAGVLFLAGGQTGTLILDPMVSEPNELVNLMQVNFLQPVYNFTFSNGLIACIVFFGIGAMSDISFILLRPWASIVVALFAEAGTFAALLLGIEVFGLPANEAASIATIGGADGPMVLFASLILAPNLFVPIAIIAYLYLSLTYAGYPYLVRLLVPKKYRGMEVEIDYPTVSKKAKFIFTVCACLLLCLLLAKPIGAYQFGEHYAASMGVNVRRFRAALIGLSCLLAACVTALVGPISFVGIAVPYMTKKLLGTAKPMAVLPGCFLLGGVFCMACDWIARTAFSPTELAISTVTAFFGAPVVIVMALKRGGGHR